MIFENLDILISLVGWSGAHRARPHLFLRCERRARPLKYPENEELLQRGEGQGNGSFKDTESEQIALFSHKSRALHKI